MKKTLTTLLLGLMILSLAATVSAHPIYQVSPAPQYQMLDADGQPAGDNPNQQPQQPNKHHKPTPKPVQPEPQP